MVLAAVVAAVAAWIVVRDQPAVYRTSTTLMIGQLIDEVNPNYSDFYTSERLAQTYSELIKREPILKATAAALGFEEEWQRLRGQVSVNLVPGTQLIEIAVTDTDPGRAKLIADEVAYQLEELVTPEETKEREFIGRQAAGFPPKIEAAQEEISRLEGEMADAFSARQIEDLQSQINSLQAQINSWQTTFAQYQGLLGEGSVKVLDVIEEAPIPTTPIGANWSLQVLLAAAMGLLLGVAAAFLLEYLDDSLGMPDEASKSTGLTTVGTIARIRGDAPADKLITVSHPRSPVSEAYRALRTNLRFSALDQPLSSCLVTSPGPNDGKSTTLANLGVVMAQAGNSVVLVDSDLRRPTLHKLFQLANREGLTNVLLQDELVLDGRLQDTIVPDLRVLTSGALPPNPSELLGSKRMSRLVKKLEGEADVVLFDSPPTLAVTDAAVLSHNTGGVLLVADAARTRKAAARQAIEGLSRVGANVLGLVLNRLPSRGPGGYYYQYEYHYAHDGNGPRQARGSWLQRIPLVGRLFI